MLKKTENSGLDSEKSDENHKEDSFCLIDPNKSLHPGMICPRCKMGKIDYNGMLNLVCSECGLTEVGAFT
jgi:uncharacterized protein (DUF983 family)